MNARLALGLSILLLASAVSAHDDATLDRMPSPRGGQVRMAGPFHFELVVEPERVILHFMDHANQSIPTADARATAKITTTSGSQTIDLFAISESALGAEATVEPLAGAKLEVTVSVPGQRPWTVTFTPTKAAPSSPSK